MSPQERERRNALHRTWYAAHREDQQAKARAAYAAKKEDRCQKRRLRIARNHESHTQWMRNWHAAHPEKAKEYARKSRQNRREQRNTYNRAYRLAHPEVQKISSKKWRTNNVDKIRAIDRRHRAARQNAPVNDLTLAQWQEIKTAHNNCCAYCGRKMQRLTQDHITPVSKRGSHTYRNVVPACQSCNSRKKSGPPLSPVQPLLITIAPSQPVKRKHPSA